ncbi:MAG: class I tRNA ligase family protein [Nanoarchaeota archaeon]|nr:class I tRNA ligase family protein [Nanoarchaeota archaeon]
MEEINFAKIEKKWQNAWEKEKVFYAQDVPSASGKVNEKSKKPKYYVLEMFPYPSGSGLHMGHAWNYTIGDIIARFKRMSGFNVLHPMGYDSLGLPAENAAIEAGQHPIDYTNKSIPNFVKQQKAIGLSYDWSRVLSTHDSSYYKWDQWIFLKMLEKGLVYQKTSAVNWCSKCNTVLANEQVHDGKCWRHEDIDVKVKQLKQWFLKTTEYAEELYENLDKMDWPDRTKAMQKNWIGKSHGTEIDFEINGNISNVVLVHGCPDSNEPRDPETRTYEKHWRLWLKGELEKRNIKVDAPLMPEPWAPDYKKWKKEFDKLDIDENSVLIGHSCGCAFLVRWLGDIKRKIKKLILVAPWKIAYKGDGSDKDFYEYKINECVRLNVGEVVIFTSNNEEEDGKKSVKLFEKDIGGEIIELKNQGHFTYGDMGTHEFHKLFDEITEGNVWPIFTTRPDTIFGVTFMVVAAQHPRLDELVTKDQRRDVDKFLKKLKSVSEKDIGDLEKEGVFTGSYAVNPANGKKVPVYAGNFVVADYGAGMVMAVPAHDQRDFEFAKKYKIDIKQVIKPERTSIVTITKSLKKEFYENVKKFGEVRDYDSLSKIYTENVDKVFNLAKENFIGGPWYIHSEGNIKKILIYSKQKSEIFSWDNEVESKEAKKFGLKVGIKKEQLDYDELYRAYTDEGALMNSGEFDGLDNIQAKREITKYLIEKKLGRRVVNFKLRDWGISRQRYWGTPIPIIHCEKCGAVPVPESDLPIELPKNVKFGKGNPLETNEKWMSVKCPKCGGKGRRESDTMDTFANSSWYFLRYCDPKNDKKIFDPRKVKYWCPVDMYIGGAEHACMHLIYSRFYVKFLRDLGLINFDEPAVRLFHQGMLSGEGGVKMSKSKPETCVLPEAVSDKYGIDTARFFLSSLASPDKDIYWSDSGINGSARFTRRIFEYFKNWKKDKDSDELLFKLNKTIKNVSGYYENFEYRKATIEIRELFDLISRENVSKETLEKFLKIFNPICPHITEELWSQLGNKDFISISKWPGVDEKKIQSQEDDSGELNKGQLNEKIIEELKPIIKKYSDKKKVYLYVMPFELSKVNSAKIGKAIGKVVEVFAVNNSGKYDPENKAKKAKPGMVAIYLE